jgi:superfamily II DNA helicase RecQ
MKISIILRLNHNNVGYDRPNLFFEVREKSKKIADNMPAMLAYIQTHPPDATGIVYCFSKKDCEKAASFLSFNKVRREKQCGGEEMIGYLVSVFRDFFYFPIIYFYITYYTH